jgi:hypothetical protein
LTPFFVGAANCFLNERPGIQNSGEDFRGGESNELTHDTIAGIDIRLDRTAKAADGPARSAQQRRALKRTGFDQRT